MDSTAGKDSENIKTAASKYMDPPCLFRTCFEDVPYLIRYEAYTGHIRDIYGTSYCLP
jgi:hypothetical protein